MKRKRQYRRYLYIPQNSKKYLGPIPIIFKSKWERNFAIWLDLNKKIKTWSYERTVIWYWDPVSRRRKRYFPDFDLETTEKKKYLIEIKPNSETKNPKRKNVYGKFTYERNKAKWEAAKKYCEKIGKEFKILTEKELFF